MTKTDPFKYFHSNPEIIRLAVMMYVRFPLSLRFWWLVTLGPAWSTASKEKQEDYQFFSQELSTKIAPYLHKYTNKVLDSPFYSSVEKNKEYITFLAQLKHEHKVFRLENIALLSEEEQLVQYYTSITGSAIVQIGEKGMSISQAESLLQSQQREERETAFHALANCRKARVNTHTQSQNHHTRYTPL